MFMLINHHGLEEEEEMAGSNSVELAVLNKEKNSLNYIIVIASKFTLFSKWLLAFTGIQLIRFMTPCE